MKIWEEWLNFLSNFLDSTNLKCEVSAHAPTTASHYHSQFTYQVSQDKISPFHCSTSWNDIWSSNLHWGCPRKNKVDCWCNWGWPLKKKVDWWCNQIDKVILPQKRFCSVSYHQVYNQSDNIICPLLFSRAITGLSFNFIPYPSSANHVCKKSST